MANRIPQKIRKLELLRDNLESEVNKIVKKYEKDIINLNALQMEEGMGADGLGLVNENPIFTGRYQLLTQLLSDDAIAPKTAGERYNFVWHGDFMSGMYVYFEPNGQYKIFSNGMGTGSKLDFFKGYKNLFGLNEHSRKLLREKIMPELRAYLKSKL